MKVLLIEDRPLRQKQYLREDLSQLEKFQFLETVEEKNFELLRDDIEKENFLKLDEYELLIVHSSAFSHNNQDKIRSYCKKHLKSLVLFSGGISSSFYDSEPFPLLNINSKDLYSKNLILLLDEIQNNKKINLLILQFGDKWEISRLMQIRDNVAVFLNEISQKEMEERIVYSEDLDRLIGDEEILSYYFTKSTVVDFSTKVYVKNTAIDLLRSLIGFIGDQIQNVKMMNYSS